MALSVSRVYHRSLSFTLNRVLLGNHSFGPGSISHTGFHMFKDICVLDHLHPQCLLMRGGWHHRALRSRRALSKGPPRSQHHAMQRIVEQRGGLTNTNLEQSPRTSIFVPFLLDVRRFDWQRRLFCLLKFHLHKDASRTGFRYPGLASWLERCSSELGFCPPPV